MTKEQPLRYSEILTRYIHTNPLEDPLRPDQIPHRTIAGRDEEDRLLGVVLVFRDDRRGSDQGDVFVYHGRRCAAAVVVVGVCRRGYLDGGGG